ncbi:MAG: hypothetical protein ABIT72_16005 [Burkholderiaceae bacterium]
MGSMVNAACKCGFDKTMSLGGGRRNFQTSSTFPMCCGDCKNMFLANTFDEFIVCPDCNKSDDIQLYSDRSLHNNGTENITELLDRTGKGRDLTLTDADYVCPACQQLTLTFSHAGYWD